MHKCAFLLIAVMGVPGTGRAFPNSEVPTSEPEYLAKVKTAAPSQIVAKATITMSQKDGTTKALQTGTNGYTCYIVADGTPVCADQNALEWAAASRAKAEPPNKVGFMYMLAGDTGANNEAPGTGRHEPLGADRPARDDRRTDGEGHAGLFTDGGRGRSNAAVCHAFEHAICTSDDTGD
jgi:hypothetical protein